MRSYIFASALLALAAGATLAQTPSMSQSGQASPVAQASAKPTPPPEVNSFDPAALDTSVDPCVDFYQYSCGNWLKNNSIPADQARWVRSFSLVQQRNLYLLWKDLDAASAHPKDALQKQYGDFFGSCMDTATIDKLGVQPIQPAWKQIADLKDTSGIPALMSKLENQGWPEGFFDFGVSQDELDSSKQIVEIAQGGISLPDRDYYIVDNPHFAEIRTQYLAHMKKMFTLAGDSPEQAQKEAAAVMEIETAMAKSFLSRTDLRDPQKVYHIYSVTDLQKLTPNYDWHAYISSFPLDHFDSLNVATPEYFKTFNDMLKSVPLDSWKSYVRWQILHGQASRLAKPIYDENFDFFSRALAGQKEPMPRWRQCTAATDRALGEAVGQDWVKENFPPAAKESMDKLIANLEKSLGQDIQMLPWMSDETKKAAAEKLAMFRQKIGYPEKWRDYSSIKVDRGQYVTNNQHVAVYDRNYDFAKLGKPVDEKEWHMTPPTVNAYYSPTFNDINFPAGVLQPPFFDFKTDPAVNYGGIGVVIGHEMTHGFDDQGAQFDGKGNLRQWQTDADLKAFHERTECVADEYSGFEAAPAEGNSPAVNLNGHLTLGENTADNGGLRIAYMALLDALQEQGKTIDEKIGGYTEAQRYFIGFAQVWCQNSHDAYNRQAALSDPHSPGKWRVNGTVQNFDEFGKAFSCKKGQPMYPQNSCRVW